MKVKDLIEELQDCDQELDVYIYADRRLNDELVSSIVEGLNYIEDEDIEKDCVVIYGNE